ncbi:MAG: hypothetical protein HQL52_12500 [Magnetococcales bacterium]|nr:hypothetical protein [Magnetococcales bacterium]
MAIAGRFKSIASKFGPGGLRGSQLLLVLMVGLSTSGCLLTKAVTVPMRVVGAATSAVPVVGGVVDTMLDTAADSVDEIPL